MVITSSMQPTFNSASYFVLAVIEGPPLTSSSHALPLLSKMKSNPYNSKELGELVTSFWTASSDLMMQRWISKKAWLVIYIPSLLSMNFFSSDKNHLPPIHFT